MTQDHHGFARTAFPSDHFDSAYFDVIVVGGGPGGLSTAISAARHGVRTLLVERHPSTTIFPRATGVSTRSMELFRLWGVDEEIRAGAIPVQPKITIGRTLATPSYASFEFGYPSDEQALAISPVAPVCCPQDHLEPVLLRHFLAIGGTAFFDTELMDFTADSSAILEADVTLEPIAARGVTAQLRDRRTGMRSTVRGRYLVGADGPRSLVRTTAGIESESHGIMAEFICVLFRADLSAVAPPPTPVLYVVEEPDGGGVIVPTDGSGRWVYGHEWDPRTQSIDEFDRAACVEMLRISTGLPDLEPEILEIMPVTAGADTAKQFQRGNVFLVGDAAHRMTPVGGLGMNTAIADGHNLGWKLAWVIRGLADPALLDTYDPERRPIGHYNALRSLERGEKETVEGLTQDLGMPYRSAAVTGTHGADGAHSSDHAGHPWECAQPGGRAPHAWVRVQGERRSTLDLFDAGMTVITGPDGQGWRAAAHELAATGEIPLSVLTVGDDLVGVDTELTNRYRFGRSGASLIRPDGHIVWQSPTASATPASDLRRVLRQAVGVSIASGEQRLAQVS